MQPCQAPATSLGAHSVPVGSTGPHKPAGPCSLFAPLSALPVSPNHPRAEPQRTMVGACALLAGYPQPCHPVPIKTRHASTIVDHATWMPLGPKGRKSAGSGRCCGLRRRSRGVLTETTCRTLTGNVDFQQHKVRFFHRARSAQQSRTTHKDCQAGDEPKAAPPRTPISSFNFMLGKKLLIRAI